MRIWLGFIFVTGIIALIGFATFGDIFQTDSTDLDSLDPALRALVLWGYVSAFGLWIWMVTDFFKFGPPTHRAAWGWSLIFFSFVAAALYFLSIYLPRIKAGSKA